MHATRRVESPVRISLVGMILLGVVFAGMTSCRSPRRPTRRTQDILDFGWPKGHQPWIETSSKVLPAGWSCGKQLWRPASFSVLGVPLPEIPGAEVVGQDEFCAECHETHLTAFAGNVHRDQGCETCHGAASLHLATRGESPNTILNLKTPDAPPQAGRPTSKPERSEVCLQCHETCQPGQQPPCVAVPEWRTTAHAHGDVACTDCHTSHYNVPPGTPATVMKKVDPNGGTATTQFADYRQNPFIEESLRGRSRHLAAVAPDVCYQCHGEMIRLEQVPHPHQIGIPFDFQCTACHDPPPQGLPRLVENHPQQFNCTTCHDPHGNVRAETRKELCLKCHEGRRMHEWHSSPHDLGGVGCTDCHNPHPKAGLPMRVDQPGACYRCHSEMQDLEEIAHAHQINGPNGFICTTCHNPHGKVQMATRRDACLCCHDGAPTMAWHSSTHNLEGVACADCHKPHPKADVPRVVHVSHTTVKRPRRLPMSVDEPEACYQCHQKIYGMTALPSHHPIAEGKMVCSDCHDAHGQARGGLKEETLNDLCYQCHAEKEGPFAYEHPPVTEDCGHCHEPHGTVANNLLRQPTTFLCLRCHTGHSTHQGSPMCLRCHFVDGDFTNVGGGPLDPMGPTTPASRAALFTDCTQCHTQVHGGDLPSGWVCLGMMRR